jgi:hypothetical protein
MTVQRVFGAIFLVLGIAMLARTAAGGGGGLAVGYVVGAIFVALGILRLRAAR